MRKAKSLSSVDFSPLLSSPYPDNKIPNKNKSVTWRQLISEWFREYVITPATQLEAEEFCLSVSLGLWGGMFPVPAVTTFVTMLLVSLLRVSATQKALALTFNMLATPLQLLSMPSFIILGNSFFHDDICDPMTLLATFNDPDVSIFTALANSSACLCAGAVVWALLGVPVVYLLTLTLTFLIKRRGQKLS